VRRRAFFSLAAGGLAGLAFAPAPLAAKSFTDSAGRHIDVPDQVRRVFPAGPPASVTLYIVAPEKMLGWTRAPSRAAQSFLPPRYARLPEVGRLTGRGNTVDLETVVALKPDLVLDVGNTTPTYLSLAERVEAQTHIPDVLLGGHLADTPATLRTLGLLLGVPQRAEALARYAERVLAKVNDAAATVAPERRLSVYIARGPHGLETAVAGSIGSEVVDLIGARNVAGRDIAPRTIVDVSPEQILTWQPDIVLVLDRRFYATIRADPVWREVRAVTQGRIHFVPDLPFSWLDNPPAPNRLIGLLWLGKLLYPAEFPQDMRAEVRHFYDLFYQQAPSETQLDALLAARPA
jgi:iron complex transport system substrate-binding protein